MAHREAECLSEGRTIPLTKLLIRNVFSLDSRDLGTYFASNQVINRDLSPEARRTALKIMLACDMGPKLAMPLIFTLGVHLADLLNAIALPAGAWARPGRWACGGSATSCTCT